MARKILCILWLPLMNRELYVDPIKSVKPAKPPVIQKFLKNSSTDVQQAIDVIINCGFKVIYPDSALDQKLLGVRR